MLHPKPIDPNAQRFSPVELVDPERHIRFQYLAGANKGQTGLFALTLGERKIGVEASEPSIVDGVDGPYLLRKRISIGADAPLASARIGGSAAFVSDDERSVITRLAAECLLVYGTSGAGSPEPENYRVLLEGREYRLSDLT